MRCVASGATGYLGTRLVPQLLSAGSSTPPPGPGPPGAGALRGLDGDGSLYRQRALFQPYGLIGQLFWSASAPSRYRGVRRHRA